MLTLAFSSPHTIESLIREAVFLLEKNSQVSAQNHAEWIVQEALGLGNRAEIYLRRKNAISENEFEAAMSLVRKHAGGTPLQYVLGETEFFSLKFQVGSGCLIPRPETEVLVEKSAAWLEKLFQPEISILDIGTGSGIIAVCLAKRFKNAKLKAVDISREALVWAEKNAKNHHVSHQIQFENADGIDILKSTENFDLIVSNPPYVSDEDFEILPEEVKNFEPSQALKGGHEGLEIIREIIKYSSRALNQNGALIFEFGGNHQTKDLLGIFRESGKYASFEIFQDRAGKDRIAQASKGIPQ
jgi:release factor glutamine methyltransferase